MGIAWTQHLRVTGEQGESVQRLTITGAFGGDFGPGFDAPQPHAVLSVIAPPSVGEGGALPLVGVRLTIGPHSWWAADLAGEGLSVSESQEGTSWSAAVPLEDWPYAQQDRPPRVDVGVTAVYGPPGQQQVVPLLTLGRVIGIRHRQTKDGRIAQVSGLDRSADLDRHRVTATWTPDLFRRRLDVVRDVLQRAGYSGSVIGSTGDLGTTVEAADEPALTLARRILEVEHQTLRFDRLGRAQLVDLAYRGSDSVGIAAEVELTALADSGVEVETRDGPTTLQVTAELPAIVGATAGGERVIEDEAPQAIDGLHTRIVAPRVQVPSGVGTVFFDSATVTDTLAGGVSEQETEISRTQVYTVREHGEIIFRRTRAWAWLYPLAPRYLLDYAVEPAFKYALVWLLDPAAVLDDAALGYLYLTDRYVLATEVLEAHRFVGGELQASAFETWGWKLARAALKWREPGELSATTWEAIPYRRPDTGSAQGAAQVLGPLKAVDGPERWRLLERRVVLYNRDGVGFEISQQNQRDTLHAEPGTEYLYDDGQTYADVAEVLQLLSVEAVHNRPLNMASHQVLRTATNSVGGFAGFHVGPVIAGYLPGAVTLATTESTTEVREVELTVTRGSGGSTEEASIAAVTAEEARRWGSRELRLRQARSGSLTAPAGPVLRHEVGRWLTVESVVGRCLVQEAEHKAGSDGLVTALRFDAFEL